MVVLARERVASKTTTKFSLALCDRQNSSRPPLQRNAPDRCRRYGALKVNEETRAASFPERSLCRRDRLPRRGRRAAERCESRRRTRSSRRTFHEVKLRALSFGGVKRDSTKRMTHAATAQTTGNHNRPAPTAMPIAAVSQMPAAVVNPWISSLSAFLRIVPAPMKPMPVATP